MKAKLSPVFTALFVVLLHYTLTPSESIFGSGSAINFRIIMAIISITLCLFFLKIKKYTSLTLMALSITIIWFVFINKFGNFAQLSLVLIFMLFGTLLSAAIIDENKHILAAIDVLLSLWIFSLIIQIIYYFASGKLFDLHHVFHPASEARISEFKGFYRFTGVMIEPGTYANWVYGLMVIRGLINKNFFDSFNIIAAISIVTTASAWGIMAAGCYMGSLVLSLISMKSSAWSSRLSLAVFVLSVSIISLFYYTGELTEILHYLDGRSRMDDISAISKLNVYEWVASHIKSLMIWGVPFGFDYCNGCQSPQDAGIFFSLIVHGGLIFSLSVFITFFVYSFKQAGIFSVFATLPIVFAKYFYFDPIFWVVIGMSVNAMLINVKIKVSSRKSFK